MTDALYQPSGMTYKYGTAWELLRYAASGAAEDWALIYKPGIYAYCYELRPDEYSSTAFLLPASQIVDQGEEYYDSIAVLAQEMRV
ncbi:zinc carboxypeptidase A 1-like [Aplysia californica]|uniref:Zinc carboxypeptidase A 1-like n=1 Tax=Aplysia californica TaxID=6500 RepID=A0ABM0K2H1_APLCA|nr:zinc carboxypeptidase A 1-like [Aplysia californica]